MCTGYESSSKLEFPTHIERLTETLAHRLRKEPLLVGKNILAETREPAASCASVPTPGGQAGPEPTRYGDWEKDGIISDF